MRKQSAPCEVPPSFEEVYADYHARILRYLTGLLGPDEAQDVSQEVFVKVSRGLEGFRGEAQLSTWIYRIALNAARDRFRAPSRPQRLADSRQVSSGCDGVQAGASGTVLSAIDERLATDEMRSCIRDFVDELAEPYRTVLVLKDLKGLSNPEIGDLLELSLPTVKIRLHRARTRLRKMLQASCSFDRDEGNDLTCERRQDPADPS